MGNPSTSSGTGEWGIGIATAITVRTFQKLGLTIGFGTSVLRALATAIIGNLDNFSPLPTSTLHYPLPITHYPLPIIRHNPTKPVPSLEVGEWGYLSDRAGVERQDGQRTNTRDC
jgi:hypothetical protein